MRTSTPVVALDQAMNDQHAQISVTEISDMSMKEELLNMRIQIQDMGLQKEEKRQKVELRKYRKELEVLRE